jgi:hypothetical protein
MREMGDGRFSDLLAEAGGGKRLVSEEKKYQFLADCNFRLISTMPFGADQLD